MKLKNLNKKLSLNKCTIVTLTDEKMTEIKGGGMDPHSITPLIWPGCNNGTNQDVQC